MCPYTIFKTYDTSTFNHTILNIPIVHLNIHYIIMKRILLLAQAIVALFTLQSCIQDEPLNAECDITGIDSTWLNEHRSILKGDPVIGNDAIVFTTANRDIDRSALNPKFTLTEGAWITAIVDGVEGPSNGITRDFSSTQTYTTHSQDGNWTKDYKVSFELPPMEYDEWLMGFENFKLDAKGKYQEWYELDANDPGNSERHYWASGNGGFAIAKFNAPTSEYPTVAIENGVKGKGLKLTTRETGWKATKMPIAAGNIFIGTFNASAAAVSPSKALKATKFGLPIVTKKPVRLEGYYKYKAGDTFTDGNYKVHPEMHDSADIYAVVYEIATKTERAEGKAFEALDGSNVLTSDRIVLMARIDKPIEFEGDLSDLDDAEWNFFSEEFKPMNGKDFSAERLADDGYAIAVVMTSSRQGAYFKGAKNSTLYVDEIKLVNEK